VLAGLSNAPQYLVMDSKSLEKGCIQANDVDSVILPKDACGGDACLAFARNKSKKVYIQTHQRLFALFLFFGLIKHISKNNNYLLVVS